MKKRISQKMFTFSKTPLAGKLVGIVFSKLSRHLPVKKIKETDLVIAFWHPKPFYEKHILIVPKKAIKNITSISKDDQEYIVEVYKVTGEIVNKLGWEKDGYTILANGGK